MKASTVLAFALTGAAFAAPEIYATDKSEPFKDLTNLKYSNDLPITEADTAVKLREAANPVKDNRNLHYNAKNKMPIAMVEPEHREGTVERREASKPFKDNRNLHYNPNKMPITMASPKRRKATFKRRGAPKPIKDNRNLHYKVNSEMPVTESY